jgi:inositol-1,3,4-trisphosphate 5/6-kinase/inositol-tetrakisphosphate 1-kinase
LQNRSRKESYVEFERPAGSRCYVEFDSQRPYPKLADFGIKTTDDEPSFRRRKKQRPDESSPESSRNTEERQQKSTYNIADGNTDGDSNLARFVTTDEIEPVTNALRDAFGLELFGFDVIVKHDPSSLFDGGSDGKEILVVDVNYFPGYKEVPNFPSLLAQYLTQKAVESRVRNLDGS